MPNYSFDDQNDLSWEKPAWTRNLPLKNTSRGQATRSGENLAAPITSLPHQKVDGPFRKPGWTEDVQEKGTSIEGDLAKPITALPHGSKDKNLEFQKPEWTKAPGLQGTKRGAALSTGNDIARPIGGIKNVSSIDEDEYEEEIIEEDSNSVDSEYDEYEVYDQ